jgi:transposase
MFEERERVLAAVAAGRSYRKVARAFDLSPPTVMRWWRESRPDDPATVAAVVALHSEGWATKDLALAAGVTAWTICRWLRASR